MFRLIIAALCAVVCLAVPSDKNPDHNGNGWGKGGHVPTAEVPEPGTVALVGGALVGLAVVRNRARRLK